MLLVDHLGAGVAEDHDGVAVRRHLRFEGLMLLDLGLRRESGQSERKATRLERQG